MKYRPGLLALPALILLCSACVSLPDPTSGSLWTPVPLERFKGTTDYELGFRDGTDDLSAAGDFNGDGKSDLVVMAENSVSGQFGFLAFVSGSDGTFSEHILRTHDDFGSFSRHGVYLQKPGIYETACSKGYGSGPCPVKFVTIENDCFTIFLYESGGATFYWKDDHFESVWTSD